MTRTTVAVAAMVFGLLGTLIVRANQAQPAEPKPAASARASLDARIQALEAKVQKHEDIEEIYNLQSIYGYYLDKRLWDEVADLFTEDAVVEIGGRGIYKGPKGPRTLFKDVMGNGTIGPQQGVLNNHLQLQAVVHVDPDGRTAKGRWRAFAQVATVGRAAMWAEGPYEIEYRKVDGKWMFSYMRWDPTYYTPFDRGWDKAADLTAGGASAQTSTKFPPDAPPSRQITPFPGTYILPFHYKHPITGK